MGQERNEITGKAAKLIGAEIRRRRTKKGWTQEALARQADMTFATINRAENGSRVQDLLTLMRIANALGCDVNDLIPRKAFASLVALISAAPIMFQRERRNYGDVFPEVSRYALGA